MLEDYDQMWSVEELKMTELVYHMPNLHSFRFCFPSSFFKTYLTKIQIPNFNVNE